YTRRLYTLHHPVQYSHLQHFPLLLYATPATQLSTLSLHDALPIFRQQLAPGQFGVEHGEQHEYAAHAPVQEDQFAGWDAEPAGEDRKSTRLNSSHVSISYAVFCLTKKTNTYTPQKLTTHQTHKYTK